MENLTGLIPRRSHVMSFTKHTGFIDAVIAALPDDSYSLTGSLHAPTRLFGTGEAVASVELRLSGQEVHYLTCGAGGRQLRSLRDPFIGQFNGYHRKPATVVFEDVGEHNAVAFKLARETARLFASRLRYRGQLEVLFEDPLSGETGAIATLWLGPKQRIVRPAWAELGAYQVCLSWYERVQPCLPAQLYYHYMSLLDVARVT